MCEVRFCAGPCQYDEAPGLAVVCGRCKGGGVENLSDDRIRHRVWFEAADGTAGSQEGVEVSCAGQSLSVVS